MRGKALALVAGSLLLTGCYRVTVISGNSPSPTVVDKPWQHSFVIGLVAPAELDVKAQCPNGVHKVVTQMSFLNGLVNGITYNLYTPVQATVTCSAR